MGDETSMGVLLAEIRINDTTSKWTLIRIYQYSSILRKMNGIWMDFHRNLNYPDSF
jgi:hypothetical protein